VIYFKTAFLGLLTLTCVLYDYVFLETRSRIKALKTSVAAPASQPTRVSVYFLIILSQTCSKLRKDSIEDSEVDNRLKKFFCYPLLMKDAKSVAGSSPASFPGSLSCASLGRWQGSTRLHISE